LVIGAYNPSGFKKGGLEGADKRFELFQEAAGRADFLMGLAEKDRGEHHIGESGHNCYMLRLAKTLGKPVHFHVGQGNSPLDDTLEILLDDIEDMRNRFWGSEEKDSLEIVAVHAISSSCKSYEHFQKTAARMKKENVGLICCPRAAISMYQDRTIDSPIHNSIALVWNFALNGVKIEGLGVDNLDDIFIPASSADIYDEAEYLANSLRFYDPRIIAKVICGRQLDDFDKVTIRQVLFPKKSSDE